GQSSSTPAAHEGVAEPGEQEDDAADDREESGNNVERHSARVRHPCPGDGHGDRRGEQRKTKKKSGHARGYQSRRRNTQAATRSGTAPARRRAATPSATPPVVPMERMSTAEVGPKSAPDPMASVVSTRTRSTGFKTSAGRRTLCSGRPESMAVAPSTA